MKSILLLAACALAAAAATAQTIEAPPAPPAAATATAPTATASPIGEATRHWLALQRSGSQAGTAHPVSGEVATLVYRRYLDSFRAPHSAPTATSSTPTSTPPGTTGASGDAGRSR